MRRAGVRASWVVFCATAVWAQTTWGGSVLTREGRTHTGQVEFKAGNQVSVTPASGQAMLLPLQDVARIRLEEPVPEAEPPAHRDPHLPLQWQQADIGRVKGPGSAQEENGVFTVRGAGWGVWGEADSFHFVYQPCVGDIDVAVRLGALPSEEDAFIAGLCIRESLDASAAQASVMLFPAGIVRMSCRPVTGESQSPPPLGNTPYQWLRLARTGDDFSGFCSHDGKTWVLAGTVKAAMAPAAYVGLACATALNHAVLGTTFDQFTLAARSMGPPEGFGLVDGSLVAGRVKRMDEQWLQYVDPAGTEQKVSANAVGYLFTRPLPPGVREAFVKREPGVTFTTGDAIEGAVQSVRDGKISVISLLFGRQSKPLSQVVTAVLRPTTTRRAYSVATRDGSIYRCSKVSVGEGIVTVENETIGTLELKADEIAEIDLRQSGAP